MITIQVDLKVIVPIIAIITVCIVAGLFKHRKAVSEPVQQKVPKKGLLSAVSHALELDLNKKYSLDPSSTSEFPYNDIRFIIRNETDYFIEGIDIYTGTRQLTSLTYVNSNEEVEEIVDKLPNIVSFVITLETSHSVTLEDKKIKRNNVLTITETAKGNIVAQLE